MLINVMLIKNIYKVNNCRQTLKKPMTAMNTSTATNFKRIFNILCQQNIPYTAKNIVYANPGF